MSSLANETSTPGAPPEQIFHGVELVEWVELMHKHIMLHNLFLTSENMDCAEVDTEQIPTVAARCL